MNNNNLWILKSNPLQDAQLWLNTVMEAEDGEDCITWPASASPKIWIGWYAHQYRCIRYKILPGGICSLPKS
jgi:hypothetical protein